MNSTCIPVGYHFQRQMEAMPAPQGIGIPLVFLCVKPWDEAGASFSLRHTALLTGQKTSTNKNTT